MSDFDHYDPRWVSDPFNLWVQMRRIGSIARTCRYGGVSCPLTLDGIRAVVLDPDSYSSRYIEIRENQVLPPFFAPPITSDPPNHRSARMMLAPSFTKREVEKFEQPVRDHCRVTLAGLAGRTTVDAVTYYARTVPAHAIGSLLDLPAENVIAFQGWDLDERRAYIMRVLAERRKAPSSDLVSRLVSGEPSTDPQYEGGLGGTVFLLLIAGVDTTATVISSALLHLSTHPADLARLRGDRSAIALATEEFLRAFAPVNSARVATRSTRLGNCTIPVGETMLLAYAAANRDPAHFSAPDEIVFDRAEKSHFAFGFGIHRCPGAGLARMLVTVALEEWLGMGRGFRVVENEPLVWNAGNVRGLKRLPLRFC